LVFKYAIIKKGDVGKLIQENGHDVVCDCVSGTMSSYFTEDRIEYDCSSNGAAEGVFRNGEGTCI